MRCMQMLRVLVACARAGAVGAGAVCAVVVTGDGAVSAIM